MSNKSKRVHFIGIGGIGMSALARYYQGKGWRVSGSDITGSKLLKELSREGIKAVVGHRVGNLSKHLELIIYNQAISDKNPEIKESKKRGIPTISYPEAVGELTKKYKTLAIAGSHGKSTTTALIAQTLVGADLDPTVIVGTRVREFGNTNFRMGGDKWLVLEADEYGRAFHHYFPSAAIVTNIDNEHLDTYKNLAGVKKSFLRFISNIQDGGVLVLNENDKNLKNLEKEIVAASKGRKVRIFWYGKNQHIAGLVSLGLLPYLIGAHNVSNASGTYALAKALGISDQIIFNTLKKFSGTWRRLEYKGVLKVKSPKLYSMPNTLCPIYDDYAHHPTEIRASLAALRQANSKLETLNSKQIQNSNIQTQHSNILQNVRMSGEEKSPRESAFNPEEGRGSRPIRVLCVFQPHQTERLAALFQDFVDSFRDADALVLLDVYKVPGREKSKAQNPKSKTANSEKLAEAIKRRYPEKQIIYLKNPKNLPTAISKILVSCRLSPVTIVLMGAGDIVKYTDLLLGERQFKAKRSPVALF